MNEPRNTQDAPEVPSFVPANPGWQAVYAGETGIAVYKDVAFWSTQGSQLPKAWVGSVGGLRSAEAALGNFVGIKGPSEDVSQWNQTVASLAAVLAAPAEAAAQLLQEAVVPYPQLDPNAIGAPIPPGEPVPPEVILKPIEKKHLLTGTIAGIVSDNVIQILPDGGGIVENFRNFRNMGVKIAQGTRVKVTNTPGGHLLLEPAPE